MPFRDGRFYDEDLELYPVEQLGLHEGWRISYSPYRPASSTYKAYRLGVSMNANSLELLRRMIDSKTPSGDH
jgi:hypothetical protein